MENFQEKKDFLKEKMKVSEKEKDGVNTTHLEWKSEDVLGYMKQFHGIDKEDVKNVIKAHGEIGSLHVDIGMEMMKSDKGIDKVLANAPAGVTSRIKTSCDRTKDYRNPVTGESFSKPASKVQLHIKNSLDKDIIKNAYEYLGHTK